MPGGRQTGKKPGNAGLTLVEILVVVAIAAILLAIAVPAYQVYLIRGHRADAVRAMLGVAACQERVRAGSGFYDTARCLDGFALQHYVLSIEPRGQAAALAFTVVATPLHAAAGDTCGTLYLDQIGTRRISGDPDRVAGCWGGK